MLLASKQEVTACGKRQRHRSVAFSAKSIDGQRVREEKDDLWRRADTAAPYPVSSAQHTSQSGGAEAGGSLEKGKLTFDRSLPVRKHAIE
jgi:hypothetical protein